MSQRTPIAKRARLGLDKTTTESVAVPRVRMITVNGVKGIWVPIHPLAEYRRG
jgi:hypothetical protein